MRLRGKKRKIVWLFLICFLFLSCNTITVSAADEIECTYSTKGVLTIKGTGTVKFSDIKKSTEDEVGYGVKKISVKEGGPMSRFSTS